MSLSQLKSLIGNEVTPEKIKSVLMEVQHSLWKLIPNDAVSSVTKSSVSHPLDAQFLQQLQELKNER